MFETKNPARVSATGRSEVSGWGADAEEFIPTSLKIQARRLARTFHLPPATARTVAEIAYAVEVGQ
jgi:hypothetical protein